MAKFTVTYKWPEYDEGIREAKHKIPAGDVERVCDKFDIGEYITLELDTVEMTCVLKQRGTVQSDQYYVELTAEWQQEKDEEEAEKSAFNRALRAAQREEKKNGKPAAEVQVAKVYDMSLGAQWIPGEDGDLRCPIIMKPRFEKVKGSL